MTVTACLRNHRFRWPAATALFAAVAALCAGVAPGSAGEVTWFLLLPVMVLAIYGGLREGVVGAGTALAVFAVCASVDGVAVSALEYVSHAVGFFVVGAAAGSVSDQRPQVGADDWFERSNGMLAEANLDGYFTRLSGHWELCLGWTREELMARPMFDFIHPDDRESTIAVAETLDRRPGEVSDFENRYMAKDGSWRWLLWSARSDEVRKYAVAKDITERKELEAQRDEALGRVEAMARTDALTGLANRRGWDEEVRRAVALAERHLRPLAVAMVDLDRFKAFNDSFGHAAGDGVLVDAAVAWRTELRSTDFLARHGGEEFAVLLADCGPGEAIGLLERLRSATPHGQTCSVGVAYWRQGDRAEELVARADAALYAAKHAGRDRVISG